MRRILTILMLVAVSAAAAQERFDHIFRRNPWNGGPNAAGIRQDSLSRSYAEIYFTKENGGLPRRTTVGMPGRKPSRCAT
jgi:hypothetical protein